MFCAQELEGWERPRRVDEQFRIWPCHGAVVVDLAGEERVADKPGS